MYVYTLLSVRTLVPIYSFCVMVFISIVYIYCYVIVLCLCEMKQLYKYIYKMLVSVWWLLFTSELPSGLYVALCVERSNVGTYI